MGYVAPTPVSLVTDADSDVTKVGYGKNRCLAPRDFFIKCPQKSQQPFRQTRLRSYQKANDSLEWFHENVCLLNDVQHFWYPRQRIVVESDSLVDPFLEGLFNGGNVVGHRFESFQSSPGKCGNVLSTNGVQILLL